MPISDLDHIATLHDLRATEQRLSETIRILVSEIQRLHRQVDQLLRDPADDSALTPKEFASLVGVAAQSVTRWCREGRIRGIRAEGPGCSWRIPRSELRRFQEAGI